MPHPPKIWHPLAEGSLDCSVHIPGRVACWSFSIIYIIAWHHSHTRQAPSESPCPLCSFSREGSVPATYKGYSLALHFSSNISFSVTSSSATCIKIIIKLPPPKLLIHLSYFIFLLCTLQLKRLCIYLFITCHHPLECKLPEGWGLYLWTAMDSGGDFPGGPVAKTRYSQCRGPGFGPWLGNRAHML